MVCPDTTTQLSLDAERCVGCIALSVQSCYGGLDPARSDGQVSSGPHDRLNVFGLLAGDHAEPLEFRLSVCRRADSRVSRLQRKPGAASQLSVWNDQGVSIARWVVTYP